MGAAGETYACIELLVFNTLDTALQDFLGSNTVRNSEILSNPQGLDKGGGDPQAQRLLSASENVKPHSMGR